MIVSRFGLHDAGGIPFLLQRNGSQNLISPELRAPFDLQIRPRNAQCPHAIDLGQTLDEVPTWVDEPLAQVFVPTPRRGGETAKLLIDPDGVWLARLAALERLCSPVRSLALPIWWRKSGLLVPTYEMTNLSPLVWSSVDIYRAAEAHKHIELAEANGRKLLLVCTGQVPLFQGIERVEPFDFPDDAPFELIGATLLRRHMESS